MPTLADIQALFRSAVVTGDVGGASSLLDDRHKRLAIHRRNYQSSLVQAILGKFRAVTWLAGEPFVTQGATSFVEEHPPQRPCIAEYGETFPRFLSMRPGAERMPYLQNFATLEWHIGHMTLAVPEAPLSTEEISRIDPESLTEVRLNLQRGVRYLSAAWPVDSLMSLYLTGTAPDRLVLNPEDVFLQIRGSRGEFHIARLEASDFAFRERLVQGLSIGAAAEQVMDIHESFDVGASLVRVITEGLAVAITRFDQEVDL